MATEDFPSEGSGRDQPSRVSPSQQQGQPPSSNPTVAPIENIPSPGATSEVRE